MALPIILAAGRGIQAAWNWFRFANDVADATEIAKRVFAGTATAAVVAGAGVGAVKTVEYVTTPPAVVQAPVPPSAARTAAAVADMTVEEARRADAEESARLRAAAERAKPVGRLPLPHEFFNAGRHRASAGDDK